MTRVDPSIAVGGGVKGWPSSKANEEDPRCTMSTKACLLTCVDQGPSKVAHPQSSHNMRQFEQRELICISSQAV